MKSLNIKVTFRDLKKLLRQSRVSTCRYSLMNMFKLWHNVLTTALKTWSWSRESQSKKTSRESLVPKRFMVKTPLLNLCCRWVQIKPSYQHVCWWTGGDHWHRRNQNIAELAKLADRNGQEPRLAFEGQLRAQNIWVASCSFQRVQKEKGFRRLAQVVESKVRPAPQQAQGQRWEDTTTRQNTSRP